MLMKHLTALTLASAASLFIGLEAEANSRFTVENQMDVQATVYIYTGGDNLCTVNETYKRTSAGETDSYGCTGNGKNRCKIAIYIDGKKKCRKQHDTCNGRAKKVDNHGHVTLSKDEDGAFVCTYDD
ncbi:MAG: hypothetical protein AAFR51_00160 [Pseudomonadota bacterium]